MAGPNWFFHLDQNQCAMYWRCSKINLVEQRHISKRIPSFERGILRRFERISLWLIHYSDPVRQKLRISEPIDIFDTWMSGLSNILFKSLWGSVSQAGSSCSYEWAQYDMGRVDEIWLRNGLSKAVFIFLTLTGPKPGNVCNCSELAWAIFVKLWGKYIRLHDTAERRAFSPQMLNAKSLHQSY